MLFVRGAGSNREATIVQLAREKDSRVIQLSSLAATTGNKAGFNRKDIREATVMAYSDNSFSITPIEDLKPGEYLLFFRPGQGRL